MRKPRWRIVSLTISSPGHLLDNLNQESASLDGSKNDCAQMGAVANSRSVPRGSACSLPLPLSFLLSGAK
jgi:hypothetical protein